MKIKKYLFLDFDGVLVFSLNALGNYHPSIEELKFFLLEHADVDVVFSTTWKNTTAFAQLCSLFPPLIRDRFVGVTAQLNPLNDTARQKEVEGFIEFAQKRFPEHKILWVAIDDRADLFEENYPHLVLVKHSDAKWAKKEDFNQVIHKFNAQYINHHNEVASTPTQLKAPT